MAGNPDERRNYPRAPIELKVSYKKLNTFFHDYTRNISKGGTFIQTSKPLKIGTKFLFKLLIPELAEPLVLTGHVKWVITDETLDENSEYRTPGMGIGFIYENNEDRLIVEKTVERLMKKHLGERAYVKIMRKE